MNSIRCRSEASSRSFRSIAATLAVCMVASFALGAYAVDRFASPRTAVVDISTVFEGYKKKKDKQKVLEAELKDLMGNLEGLDKERKLLIAELKQLREDAPLYIDKLVRQKELELRIMQLRDKKLKILRERQFAFLKEIRDEITLEIEAFSRIHDLDIVFENQVVLEGEAGGVGFQWPIIHYAKKARNITAEITARLNGKYKP